MKINFCTEHHHHPGPGFGAMRIAALAVGGVAFAVLFAFLFGWFVELLWNWLMPDLFALKSITYWQAFGIVVLAKLLFGGCGKHHPGHHGRHWRNYYRHWKDGDNDNGDVWKPRGSYHNWKYYDRYWREEGKAAFEAYIDKIEKDG